MIMEKKFAENLITFRKEKGLSQAQLSTLAGVTQQCVSMWEKGSMEPTMKALWRLADIFDVSIDVLVGRKDY